MLGFLFAGLNPAASSFFVFVCIIIVIGLASQGLGVAVSAGAKNEKVALALAPAVTVILILFGGFYVNEVSRVLSNGIAMFAIVLVAFGFPVNDRRKCDIFHCAIR